MSNTCYKHRRILSLLVSDILGSPTSITLLQYETFVDRFSHLYEDGWDVLRERAQDWIQGGMK